MPSGLRSPGDWPEHSHILGPGPFTATEVNGIYPWGTRAMWMGEVLCLFTALMLLDTIEGLRLTVFWRESTQPMREPCGKITTAQGAEALSILS
jgi:hypothetical protein